MTRHMRLIAANFGKLDEQVAFEQDKAARAITGGTTRAATELQIRLRQQVMATLGSRRVANAWRLNVYPKGKPSMGPAALVYSNAPHIIEAFSRARMLKSPNGFFLAIPSPDCPREYMGKRVTPSNWNEERYGPLRFVYRRTGPSLLVVDAVKRNKAGSIGRRMSNAGLTSTGKYRKGYTSVVMFFLVPFVRLKQFWDLDAQYAQAGNDMVRHIIEAWQ
jgi:hypothetical protein